MTATAVPAEAFPPGEAIAVGDTLALRASRCESCGRTEFPARRSCPACGGSSPEVGLPTVGRLCGFTSVLHAPPGAKVDVPYHVGVAEFDGTIRIMGLLDEPPDDLSVGMSVEAVAISPGDDLITYGFRIL